MPIAEHIFVSVAYTGEAGRRGTDFSEMTMKTGRISHRPGKPWRVCFGGKKCTVLCEREDTIHIPAEYIREGQV